MNAVLLSETDTVATATEEIPCGKPAVCAFGSVHYTVIASETIPIYHKFAVSLIRKGDSVVKYGERIGIAQADISPGDLVHTHNLSSK